MKDTHLVLKELRLKHALAQAEVAELCGLSRASITNIESGTQKLTLKTLEALADALGYEVTIKFIRKGLKNG
jgi:transcriptional regulator with XRE-family HTH domain